MNRTAHAAAVERSEQVAGTIQDSETPIVGRAVFVGPYNTPAVMLESGCCVAIQIDYGC